MTTQVRTKVSNKTQKPKVPSMNEFMSIYKEIDQQYEGALRELARR